MGELVEEPVDHPIIRPSINALARTYDLANEDPELASAISPVTGGRVNRFLHVSASPGDLVMQNKMQRRLGQLTGTCFQRCVGMDALNSLHSMTYDLDEKHGTDYHVRFKRFLARMQNANCPETLATIMIDRRKGRPVKTRIACSGWAAAGAG
jgi:4-hydroxybutyryl-CoA dehydratase/vinylacetyl-CoA-Delta-isomerase